MSNEEKSAPVNPIDEQIAAIEKRFEERFMAKIGELEGQNMRLSEENAELREDLNNERRRTEIKTVADELAEADEFRGASVVGRKILPHLWSVREAPHGRKSGNVDDKNKPLQSMSSRKMFVDVDFKPKSDSDHNLKSKVLERLREINGVDIPVRDAVVEYEGTTKRHLEKRGAAA